MSPAGDVYAMGILTWEVLTGKRGCGGARDEVCKQAVCPMQRAHQRGQPATPPPPAWHPPAPTPPPPPTPPPQAAACFMACTTPRSSSRWGRGPGGGGLSANQLSAAPGTPAPRCAC
jgi:hypothetical protein